MFSLIFSRRYAMAHRFVAGLSEKCAVPHGHNEVVTVTLQAVSPSALDGGANMVMPFERAKATWHRWIDDQVDHSFHLSADDPLLDWFKAREPHRLARILVTPGDPTTEALAACFAAKISAFLAADGGLLVCTSIQIEETPTNIVTFRGNPEASMPAASRRCPWWIRADMSINDFEVGRHEIGGLARSGSPMSYAVKEIFYTLQGEGAQSGRPAVFCRFAGCNLWSGREDDRAGAVCQFCDTDFVGVDGTGGGRFSDAPTLAAAVAAEWPGGGMPFVVCTGGEPLLQLDAPLIAALHDFGFEIAVETNGSVAPAPSGLDWICVSPKAGAPLCLTEGDELKLVVPQPGIDLERLEQLEFRHFSLQPMDGPAAVANTQTALEMCLRRPKWRLSLQTHKLIGLR